MNLLNYLRAKQNKIKSLNYYVEKEQKEIKAKNKIEKLKKALISIYIPSLSSFILVLIVTLISFIISHLLLNYLKNIIDVPVIKTLNNHNALISIHAGIGTIIFALIIFVAENLRDKEGNYRARVLLREGFLFPLTVAEILVFFIFIFGNVYLGSILPVIIIGLLTIISLARIIKVLLNRYLFAQKRNKVMKERLKVSIDLAVKERIANNILFKKLDEEDIMLKFQYFPIDDESNYYIFNIDKKGVISDIDIEKLKDFAEIIEKEAKSNGYSFSKNDKYIKNLNTMNKTESMNDINQFEEYETNKHRYLKCKFSDMVNENNNNLIYIEKKLINDQKKIEELQSMIGKIFIIKKDNNFTEEMRRDLFYIKDQVVGAIKNEELGKLEELIELYVNLAEGFLDYIDLYMGGYSLKQATKEKHSIWGGWAEVRWLTDDIREIYEKAMNSNNKGIILRIGSLPVRIARLAINYYDHYLFSEFIPFIKIIYRKALKKDNKDIKDLMIDRSWRYLKETINFYIEPKLRKDNVKIEEKFILTDYVIYSFKVFQDLLKISFDYKDLSSFKKYTSEAIKILDFFQPSKATQNVESLKIELEYSNLSNDQKKKQIENLERQKALEKLESKITNNRNQMFFGISSWLLYELKSNNNNETSYFDYIHKKLPSNLVKLTQIFIDLNQYENQNFWGWDRWEDRPDEGTYSIKTFENLKVFYIIKSLLILESKSNNEIKEIELPYNRSLANLINDEGNLIKTLNNISNNKESWEKIISIKAIDKVDTLKELLLKAKRRQEEQELELKRKKDISVSKVKEFKDNIKEGFYTSVLIRNIFQYYELYIDQSSDLIKKETNRFGINIVDDKGAFIENWSVNYLNWGKNYGREIALGENDKLLSMIAKNCEEVESFNKALDNFDKLNKIIILTSSRNVYSFLSDIKDFTPKWKNKKNNIEINNFNGFYKYNNYNIPIFSPNCRTLTDYVFILNTNKLGNVIQYSPLNSGENKNLKDDIFYMDIKSFSNSNNKNILEEMINNPPEWLKEKGGKEAQMNYLYERVLVKVFERFEFNKSDNFKGYKFKL